MECDGIRKKVVVDFKTNIKEFGQMMELTNKQFKKQHQELMENNSALVRFGTRLRLATRGLHGFRMEILGIMFFGMAMQRFFVGMLRPAMEIVGVFEIWGVILQTLFLPIVLELLPYLLSFMEWVMGLPGPVKKAIGVFVLIGAALGYVLQTIGMLALGLGSLFGTGTFISVAKAFLSFFGKIAGFISGTLVAVIGVIIAIIIGMWVSWKENFANMRDWVAVVFDGVKNMFTGVVQFITGLLQVLVGIFTLDLDRIKEGFGRMVEGIKQFFFGLLQTVTGIIVSVGIGVLRVLRWVWDRLSGWFMDLVSKAFTWGVDIFKKLAEGIKSMAPGIKDAILGLFPKWARDMIWRLGQFTIKIFTRSRGGESTSTGSADDFISRPGEGLTKINPNDTVVGFKGESPFGKSVNITQNITVTGSLMDEVERLIKENNSTLVDDIKSMVSS